VAEMERNDLNLMYSEIELIGFDWQREAWTITFCSLDYIWLYVVLLTELGEPWNMARLQGKEKWWNQFCTGVFWHSSGCPVGN
jgi:hypothetical protein